MKLQLVLGTLLLTALVVGPAGCGVDPDLAAEPGAAEELAAVGEEGLTARTQALAEAGESVAAAPATEPTCPYLRQLRGLPPLPAAEVDAASAPPLRSLPVPHDVPDAASGCPYLQRLQEQGIDPEACPFLVPEPAGPRPGWLI
mgnify:FL=1